MSFFNQFVFKATIFLKSFVDWNEWILIINFIIDRYDINEYANLNKFEKSKFMKSKFFQYFDVKTKAIKFIDLNMLMNRHKIIFKIIKFKFDVLKFLNTHIISIVDRINMMHFMKMKIVYQKFQSLKIHIIFIDRIRKLKIIKKYKTLQNFFKLQQIAQWISDWKKIYDDAVKLNISDINDILSLYDFLNIIRFIEFFYVAIQKLLIEYFIKRAEKTIIMKKLLKNYRNHVKLIRILIKSKKKISHSIFAILQNESFD